MSKKHKQFSILSPALKAGVEPSRLPIIYLGNWRKMKERAQDRLAELTMSHRAKQLDAMPLLNNLLKIQALAARRGWVVVGHRWGYEELPLPAPRVIGL